MNSILLNKHFPGCVNIPDPDDFLNQLNHGTSEPIIEEVGDLFSADKVKWSIDSFDSYKSPGSDGIVPMMLKCVKNTISPLLSVIYTDCIRFNYIPKSWRKVKVVFIPKAGKLNHSTAKDYRPISLSSFLLKVAERILDYDIRSLFDDTLISK
ncbi:hypothetical protein, partial [Streptomyces sp. IBSBF 2390]|uniref:hypothetical protein n=1 Tax=Streptomyces sp. IBSBF 2390 TaxID=2903533 RepID=UPI002FDC706A